LVNNKNLFAKSVKLGREGITVFASLYSSTYFLKTSFLVSFTFSHPEDRGKTLL
jgi:hypothetical protein